MVKSKVYFSKSGSGSISGRVTIPKAYLDAMKINELEKDINIEFDNGNIIISKVKVNRIEGVSYDEMVKYILNNVEYTYNVSRCLNDFINECSEGIFYMTEDQEHFKIKTHYKILNEGMDNEEIVYTYDVEKIDK